MEQRVVRREGSGEHTPLPRPESYGYPQASQPGRSGGTLVQDYVRTLRRRKLMIAGLAMCGLIVGLAVGVGVLPVYQTHTSVDIRSLNGDFMNMKSVDPTGNESVGEGDTNLQTQIKLLQSDTLVQDTVDRMLAEPHPAYVERMDVVSQVRRLAHLGTSNSIPYRAAVEDAARRLKVKPLGLTRLVEITCASWSADIAAKFCNTLSRRLKRKTYR